MGTASTVDEYAGVIAMTCRRQPPAAPGTCEGGAEAGPVALDSNAGGTSPAAGPPSLMPPKFGSGRAGEKAPAAAAA